VGARPGGQHPGLQRIQRATVALLRGDRRDAIDLLSSYVGYDVAVVHYLIRAGAVDRAADVFERLTPLFDEAGRRRVAAELAAARGNPGPLTRLLDATHPTQRSGMWFAAVQTLAESLVAHGHLSEAIRVLESVENPERVYTQNHFGYRWIEARALLADIYRRMGRVDDAHAIEQDLLALLVIADEDLALLRKLRGLQHDTVGRPE
jgi:hypothetical protein